MKKLAILWILAGACIVASAAWVLWRARPDAAAPRVESALAIVPPGAALVLSLDVPRLAASPAGDKLVERSATLLGLGGDHCAARTIRQATSLALVVDGARETLALPEPSEIAIIASGPFVVEAVAICVEHSIQKKKGRAVRTTVGSFTTVRDQRSTSGEVAVREGGPLVISNGRYLRDILDAADGQAPQPTAMQRARDALHAALRKSFGGTAPLIATVTLPRGWLERTLGDRDAKLSPLSELRSAALRLEPAGDGFVLEALLGHSNPEAALRVEKLSAELLPEVRPLLSDKLGARPAAQLEPRRDGADLRFSLHLTQGELDKLLALTAP